MERVKLHSRLSFPLFIDMDEFVNPDAQDVKIKAEIIKINERWAAREQAKQQEQEKEQTGSKAENADPGAGTEQEGDNEHEKGNDEEEEAKEGSGEEMEIIAEAEGEEETNSASAEEEEKEEEKVNTKKKGNIGKRKYSKFSTTALSSFSNSDDSESDDSDYNESDAESDEYDYPPASKRFKTSSFSFSRTTRPRKTFLQVKSKADSPDADPSYRNMRSNYQVDDPIEEDENFIIDSPSFDSTNGHSDSPNHLYELYSILIHSGSANGGHYYAYIKVSLSSSFPLLSFPFFLLSLLYSFSPSPSIP